MVDFMMVSTRSRKNGLIEIYPNFIIKNPSKDLMIRGRDFYAIWVEERGLWSVSEQDVIEIVDQELDRYAKENAHRFENGYKIMYMRYAESGMIDNWHKYCQRQMRDSFHMLDEKLIFSNMETGRNDYASKKLPYPLETGEPKAWDRLISVLYTPQERKKIEWAIGAIVSGDSRELQKFMVFYGAAGTGKSTIINVIEKLFAGYIGVFHSKALSTANNQFALEAFKDNPLVAIEHDGDLSKIEDNTRLNSLVSHEKMTVNEKFKGAYTNSFKCFLFMGTNKPVHITDAKSGLIRRLIDVTPTGNKIPRKEYTQLIKQMDFELGAIAHHCQQVYLEDPSAYDDYIPIAMLGASNDFYNFVMDSWAVFKKEDETTLKAAWEMYKTYCDDTKVPYPYPQRKVKEELKNYFREFIERETMADGSRVRNYYKGFRSEKFEEGGEEARELHLPLISLKDQLSILDTMLADCPAQYANESGTPMNKWANVKTVLRDLDTTQVHYLKVPSNHIVIDFDMVGPDGEKDFQMNLEEASKWPPTYTEVSKSGKGIHLHYIYAGDPSKLSCVYDDKIEVKVFTGNGSLRRRRSLCNDLPIATLSHGLPLKEAKKTVNFDSVQSEKGLRKLIERNLRKEILHYTKPSIDFIHKILEDAYASDLVYDVSDMRPAIIAFAAGSHNQSDYCLKLISQMRFKSKEGLVYPTDDAAFYEDMPIVFYDVEVFPNLLLVNWKAAGEGKPVVRMINPKPADIEKLLRFRLVGFNCRRYDNHILYGCLMGFNNEQLYKLSTRIIEGDRNAFFGEAYNISYTDVYDFAAKKQSLKKWEIEFGIHHQELGLPWDQAVPEDQWEKVAEYCDNDVIATEVVFNELAGDFTARKILADIAGMTVNDTSNSLTTRIIFGKERHPKLIYTDLATGKQYLGDKDVTSSNVINYFPGYEFRYWRDGDSFADDKKKHNVYRDTDIGKGGYIRSWPGMYGNVALLDVASMHPNSIRAMNCFGEFTKNYTDILDARIAIKHKDYDSARKMMDGKLAPYLNDPKQAKNVSNALKIPINSVYGLTAASFENPFRDPRNANNIVALRGALFMRTLQDEVTNRGFQIVAIKTDSIKIADATPEIIKFCFEFAAKYGYTFEHEATYEKMCQINDADYIAKYKSADNCKALYGYIPEKNGECSEEWTATGAQFAVPYVFKTLFTHETIEFKDLCETKEVKSALYLDMNEMLPDVTMLEKEQEKLRKADPDGNAAAIEDLSRRIEKGHQLVFIGKVGSFCPMKPGAGGGLLMRSTFGDKYAAATGSKGYRWMESEMVSLLGKEADIDRSYYDNLANEARDNIAQYGDFEWFASEDRYDVPMDG